jgi:FAD/FMN-containing dehydrogenase
MNTDMKSTPRHAGADSASAHGDIVDELRRLVGEGGVLTGNQLAQRARNFWDPSPLEGLALVRPRTTQEVSAVLRLCHERGQAVVTHGGKTGVCDGDRAGPSDVIVSLERMTAIEEIDPIGRTATVQAGCILQMLQETVEKQGLLFTLDLGGRGSCTIGGNVATNAGGINVIRYGMMRALVLGLEAVLADGTIVSSMNRMLKNNSAYDLKQLFIGTEGTLGIVTRVIVKLHELPQSAVTALVALENASDVPDLLKHMDRRLGGMLSSYEVMWGEYYRKVTEPGWHDAPLSRDYPYYVVMEAQGSDQVADAARFESALEAAMEAGLVVDAVLPKSRAERDKCWAIRENFEAVLKLKTLFLYDISLPIKDMMQYMTIVETRLKTRWPEAHLIALGHIGDGNLHFFVWIKDAPQSLHDEVDRCVYEPLAEFGGAISAEHGIGLEKKRWLPVSRSPSEIELMRVLKRSLDPRNILNPGKVIDAV